MYNLRIMWKRYWDGLTESERRKVTIGLVIAIMIVVIGVWSSLGSTDTIFDSIRGLVSIIIIAFLFFKGFRYFWLNIWLARPFADPVKRRKVRILIVGFFVLIAIGRCLNAYQ
jgi:hypothetical protein